VHGFLPRGRGGTTGSGSSVGVGARLLEFGNAV